MTAYVGHCIDVMQQLIAQGVKVQACVTSPPYWGLRDYNCPPVSWGGDSDCEHEWGNGMTRHKGGPHGNGVMLDGGRSVIEAQASCKTVDAGKFCQQCGAWCGQLGLEPTIELYIEHMVDVFRYVRELLKDDGTLWLNIGDSYATGAGSVGNSPGGGEQGARWLGTEGRGNRGQHLPHQAGKQKNRVAAMGPVTQPNRMPQAGLKPKDLCMVPARLALALQADGWWVRQDIIWSKPNPMPESVTDRCTKAHEYLYILTKRERYYFDAAAIAEPLSQSSIDRLTQPTLAEQKGSDQVPGKTNGRMKAVSKKPNGWSNSENYHGADPRYKQREIYDGSKLSATTRNKRSVWTVATQPFSDAHFATFPPALIEPCILAGSRSGDIVFDPFLGSGTTGMVAERLGRQWIGIDIQPEYTKLQKKRIQQRGLPL